MFMRRSTQKRADGSLLQHYQLIESVWNREKKRSEPKIIYNFGRVDDPETVQRLRKLAKSILRRVSPDEIVAEHPEWRVTDAWVYGDLYVLEQLWRRAGLAEVINRLAAEAHLSYPVERALFAMVANRATAPVSKLSCWERWLQDEVRIEGAGDLELHHLYRAMDFLQAHKEQIEEEIFFRVADLFNVEVDLLFYDTTSLYFEIDDEDRPGLRRRGYSKDGRGDAPQIVVGMAVTRDGFPVRHWVFPGNTVDVTTVKTVKEDLKGWHLSRCVFVGDAGMVSAENLRRLSAAGGRYIVGMPVHRGGQVSEEVMTRPGRFRQVAANLRVKEVVVGDGERRRRYVLCFNSEEAERQRRHREELLNELDAELESLGQVGGKEHSKRVCALVTSKRFGRYLARTRGGKIVISRRKIREAEKRDGKWVVHTNDDTLSAEDMALGYKQLMRVEEAWRQLKTGLAVRPVYHWAEHRIQAHVAISVLALLLERMAEVACEDTWRNIRHDLRRVKLAQLSSPNGTIWQVTEPPSKTRKRLRDMKIDNPPLLLDHA